MNCRIRLRMRRMVLMASLCLMPGVGYGFSFGSAEVRSHLGEPLNIRVPFQLSAGESLSQTFIALAGSDVYAKWGLQPYMDMSDLRLQVHKEQKTQLYVEVVSDQPMTMALVSFILEAKEEHHQYYKQVRVMLDPVAYEATRVYTTHEVLPPLSQAGTVMPRRSKIVPADTLQTQGWARAWRYGPVRSGDSLSTIAYRLRRDKRWSNHEVMLALYRANPDAFVDGDMNQLKAGVWLQVPHEERLKTLLAQAPSPAERKKTRPHPVKKAAAQTPSTKLHFVGHISAQVDTKHMAQALDVTAVRQRLDDMYDKSMHMGLRVDGVDASLLKLNQHMDKVEHALDSMQKQQSAIESRVNQLAVVGEKEKTPAWWGWVLFALLVLNSLGILLLYRKLTERRYTSFDVPETIPPVATQVEEHSKPVNRVSEVNLDNLIYDIEKALDHEEYARAEALLKEVKAEHRKHIRVAALQVRLYHESKQMEQRDNFVREQRKDLSESQWRAFCDRLPSHIWQSLLVAGIVEGLSDPSYVREDMAMDDTETTLPVNHVESEIAPPLSEEPGSLDDMPMQVDEQSFFEGVETVMFDSSAVAELPESEVSAYAMPLSGGMPSTVSEEQEEVVSFEQTSGFEVLPEDDDSIAFSPDNFAFEEHTESKEKTEQSFLIDDEALEFDISSLFEDEEENKTDEKT